jgi:hypothetical protein
MTGLQLGFLCLLFRVFISMMLMLCIIMDIMMMNAGLIAANLVVDRLGIGSRAMILDTEPDEPHIQIARDAASQARMVIESLESAVGNRRM